MISIIIPTFNRCDFLKNTIESILKHNSNFMTYEIIVVDNGSEDATEYVVDVLIQKNPLVSISYVFDEIPGLLTGRHRGIKEAKGEILTFIDDDVLVDENWLTQIYQVFEENQHVSLLTGPCLPSYEVNPPDWLTYFWTENEYGKYCGWLSLLDFGNQFKEIDPLFVWGLNFSIRKKDLLFLGGFHPDNIPASLQQYQGDGETGLALKAKLNNKKAYYHPDVLVLHQISESRLSLDYFKKRAFYQGVADSFTDFRAGIQKKISDPMLKRVKRKIKSLFLPKSIQLLQEMEKERKTGYLFHQTWIEKDSKVKEWVLKDNYFDYKLPL